MNDLREQHIIASLNRALDVCYDARNLLKDHPADHTAQLVVLEGVVDQLCAIKASLLAVKR